jgi:hypothetical protein
LTLIASERRRTVEGWAAGAATAGSCGDLRRARRTEAEKIGGVTLQIIRY